MKDMWIFVHPSKHNILISRAPHPSIPPEKPATLNSESISVEGSSQLNCVNILVKLLDRDLIEEMK